MSNRQLANSVLQGLWNYGVREVVLCAGARNAPFVNVLAHPGPLRVHSFFEERSAAFFALGTPRLGDYFRVDEHTQCIM